ncbi:MAG: bifunctional glutamate N-acetyltransferase/amino-acid acetyltransferase ArgJ [Actinomycetota bacterium]|nr:bifunctional glutamate N-acetyltransferase/amino-acid acetyltransferase ArgJ [Actinomycetota bacterium]MDI6822209.1 bifunctional glutamate N-acetyltransferase/amino-acid acetyltransferase ArgJ [Actinomycetota bacterium]
MVKVKVISGGVTASSGFKASGVSCGIKGSGRKDLALIFSEVPAIAAVVFTTNKMAAPPVLISKKHVQEGVAQAVVINSGNANSCTGRRGITDAIEMAKITAGELTKKCLGKISPYQILLASTGIIGVPLPMDKLKRGIQNAVASLSYDAHLDAAEAIMTTDSFPKEMAIEFKIGNKTITLGGMTKGAGMIAPNMATTLSVLTSDIRISHSCLKRALRKSVDKSFNMITVDGEMSTNDMVVILANGIAQNQEVVEDSKDALIFQEALDFLTQELAKMVVRDGEGATKFIEIIVRGGKSFEDAKTIAMTVANSNLVKTAFFGEDINWGRIIASIGHSGAEINPHDIDIYLSHHQIVKGSVGLPFNEGEIKEVLKDKEIRVTIDLNLGDSIATVWTTDLSYDYVKINAAYKT